MHQQTYLLKRLKTSRFPSRFIVLDRLVGLCQWCVLDYKDGLWTTVKSVTIEICDDLIPKLEEWCKRRETVWMVGWKMYEALCAACLYDAIEAGAVGLKMCRKPKHGTDAQTVWQQAPGALVCDSPPTIIDLDFGRSKYLRCIDLANWGLEPKMFRDMDCNEMFDGAIQAVQDYVSMVRTLEMGSLQSTAAGQGYCRFRTHDLKDKIVVHQDQRARALERRAYFGGRCEALQVGPVAGPLYYVDVKAMYSSIARYAMMPTELLYVGDNTSSRMLPQHDIDHYYIADVVIRCEQPLYPARIGLHTYYPVGRYMTTLADQELRGAITRGHVESVGMMACYRNSQVWYGYATWYFESLDHLERLGLDHMRPALKLAVNASYGKVGARGKRWVNIDDDGTDTRWGQWWITSPADGEMTMARAISGQHQYLDTGGEPASSIPSMAAAITSYGRCWLWDLICQAGRKNVYYVDTDGLLVSRAGKDNLRVATKSLRGKPGDIELRDTADDAWIGGIKHYRFGDTWVQAGVPNDAERDSDGRAKWLEQEPFAYGLWHGEPFHVRQVERTRYGCRPYEHGSVGPDLRVSPLRADVLDGPDGPETVIYGLHGPIRASALQKRLTTP